MERDPAYLLDMLRPPRPALIRLSPHYGKRKNPRRVVARVGERR